MDQPICLTCETRPAGIGSRGRQLKYCSNECRNGYKAKARILAAEAARAAVEKVCRQCDRKLPVSEFHNDRRRLDGRYPWCKDCRREYMGTTRRRPPTFASKREYDIDYRAKSEAYARTKATRARYLWTQYRITPEEYAAMLDQQQGRCAICRTGTPPSSSKYGNTYYPFAIDHDHDCCPGATSCGRCIRGLLCGKCNSGLGLFRDESNLLSSAIDYLAGWNIRRDSHVSSRGERQEGAP